MWNGAERNPDFSPSKEASRVRQAEDEHALSVAGILRQAGAAQSRAVVMARIHPGLVRRLALPPEDVMLLSNLLELDLSDSLLSDFSALGALPSLRALNLAGNAVRLLPELAPGQFSTLETLDISYNQLSPEALISLAKLPALKELDVSGNGLEAIPSQLGDDAASFRRLHTLRASNNCLTGAALAAAASWPRLAQLVLSHNWVSNVPELSRRAFVCLTLLDLSSNGMSDPDAVARLGTLASLSCLLLAGCPVASKGSGGHLKIVHNAAVHNAPRSRPGSLLASRPALGRSFKVSVEEVSAVTNKARALSRQSNTATQPAAEGSDSLRGSTSAVPSLPSSRRGTINAAAVVGPEGGGAIPPALVAAEAAAILAARPSPTAALEVQRPAGRYVDWGVKEESEHGAGGSSAPASNRQPWEAQKWSNESAWSAALTAADSVDAMEGDPTMWMALQLGLDPQQLQMCGGLPPRRAGKPATTLNALRTELCRPSAAGAMGGSCEGVPSAGHHLKLTWSMLAKQRRKAGEGEDPEAHPNTLAAKMSRLQTIDKLMASIRRQLEAVAGAAHQADVQPQ